MNTYDDTATPIPFEPDDPRQGLVAQGKDSGTDAGQFEFIDTLIGVATPRNGRGGAKAVLANESTKVVSFEFRAGDILNEHATRHPILIQVIRGRIECEVQGERIQMAPGQIIHLTPMLRHAVRALEDTTLTVTMLLPHDQS